MLYLAALIGVVASCTLLHVRHASPWRLYATATGTYLFLSLASIALAPIAPGLIWSLDTSEPGTAFFQPSDNSNAYTLFIAPLLPVLVSSIPPVATTLVLWAQEHSGAMLYPALSRWLFWPIAGGTFLVPVAVMLIVFNTGWYADQPDLIVEAHASGRRIALIAFALLAFTSLWSVLRTVTRR